MPHSVVMHAHSEVHNTTQHTISFTATFFGLLMSFIITSKVFDDIYFNLPKSQLNRLQLIQNSLARAVVKAPKLSHTNPILKALHWLKTNECINYMLLSLMYTYKVLTTTTELYESLPDTQITVDMINNKWYA